MQKRELTEDGREKLLGDALKRAGLERWRPPKKELEKEIIDYLNKKHPCCLATCGKDGIPRISVVEYMNEGLTIYIMSEGGEKFRNLEVNNRVAVGIGSSARTYKSERGVNISGIAEIFDQETPEFARALRLFMPMFKQFGFGVPNEETLSGDIVIRVIRIVPTKIVYNHSYKGILNEHWVA